MAKGSLYSSESWHPPGNKETFRDLLVFEERLKQNAERLAKTRRKYELFLGSLVSLIAYFGYYVGVKPSIYSLVHYLNVTLLLILTVTLVLFFATGMYSEKITYAHKFIPQANRALRPFNMYLNTRSRFFWARKPPLPLARSPQPMSRSPSAASTSSSRSISTSGAKSPPASPRLRPQPAPIPPATNPRGELIFSTRVSQVFRDGYERYRLDWEKRRIANLKARPTSWPWAWLRRYQPPLTSSTTSAQATAPSAPTDTSEATKEKRKQSGRSRTSSSASAASSRQASPRRAGPTSKVRSGSPASPRRRASDALPMTTIKKERSSSPELQAHSDASEEVAENKALAENKEGEEVKVKVESDA